MAKRKNSNASCSTPPVPQIGYLELQSAMRQERITQLESDLRQLAALVADLQVKIQTVRY